MPRERGPSIDAMPMCISIRKDLVQADERD